MLTDSSRPGVSGIVLAGGQSRRFGEEDKAVAVLDGSTFIERTVEAVCDATDDRPIVAVNDDEQHTTVLSTLESNVDPRFAFDAPSFEGPLSGLYGALPYVDNEWLFVTGCDMPRLSPAAVAWLAGHLRTTDSSSGALVPVHFDGGCEPLHAFYRRDAVADARRRLRPDASLRKLLDSLPDSTTVPIPSAPPDVPLATSVENVNTKQDYRRIRRTIEQQ